MCRLSCVKHLIEQAEFHNLEQEQYINVHFTVYYLFELLYCTSNYIITSKKLIFYSCFPCRFSKYLRYFDFLLSNFLKVLLFVELLYVLCSILFHMPPPDFTVLEDAGIEPGTVANAQSILRNSHPRNSANNNLKLKCATSTKVFSTSAMVPDQC